MENRLMDKLEIILKQDLDEIDLDFEKMHERVFFDLKKKPLSPEIVLSFGRNDRNDLISVATLGNISMIIGEEKSRKTWLKSLITGCLFGGNATNHSNFIVGYLKKGFYVINIDTEQGKYDAWNAAIRVPKIIGSKHEPYYPSNLINIFLREYSKKQRLKYIEWLILKSELKGKIAVVFIDGFVDLVNSFNDEIESSEVVQKLMTLSSVANCHIMGVLHTNPGSDKGRGHLGTILQQKCESVIYIKKEEEISVVTAKRMRKEDFKPFNLTIGPDYLPYANHEDEFVSNSFPQSNYNPFSKTEIIEESPF